MAVSEWMFLLVPAETAVKRLCVCVCVRACVCERGMADVNQESNLGLSFGEHAQLVECKLLISAELGARHTEPITPLTRKLTHTHTHAYTCTHTHTHTHACMNTCAHAHTYTRLTALFPRLPGWASTRKVKPIWISLKLEIVSGSGISWAMCRSAPCSRQITTPAPHHSVFYRPDALPAAQPTASMHWRHSLLNAICNSFIKMYSPFKYHQWVKLPV